MKSWIYSAILPLFAILPATRLFGLKRALLRCAGADIASEVKLVSSVRVYLGGKLTIGRGSWIGHQTLIVGGKSDVTIGEEVDIAPRVLMATGHHEVAASGPKAAGPGYSLPVKIGDGCWIGANATILGGSTIGDASIVAANAMVKGDFPAKSLIGGCPARVIRSLA